MKDWKDITINQFIKLKSLVVEDFETPVEFVLEQMQIVKGLTEDQLERLGLNDLMEFKKEYSFIHEVPDVPIRKELNPRLFVDELILKDFKELKLEDFIDLEFYSSKGVEYLVEMVATLYRKQQQDRWGNKELEPLTFDFKERVKRLGECSVYQVYGAIKDYMVQSKSFVEKRRGLFGLDDEPEDDEEIEEVQDSGKERLLKKWSWELLIYNLAGKDVTKIDEVTNMNLHVAFKFIAMKKELKLE